MERAYKQAPPFCRRSNPTNNFYSEYLTYCRHVGFSNPRLPRVIIGAQRENSIVDGMIIDFSCNSGRLIAPLTQSGCAAVGVDISMPALASHQRKNLHPARRYIMAKLPNSPCSGARQFRHSVKCSVTPPKWGSIHSLTTVFFDPTLPLSYLAPCWCSISASATTPIHSVTVAATRVKIGVRPYG